jgi:hypothetical protein
MEYHNKIRRFRHVSVYVFVEIAEIAQNVRK